MMSFLFLAAAIATQAVEVSQPNPAPAAKAGSQKKICEVQEITGSRLGAKRICMTADEWEVFRRNNRTELERAQKNTTYKNAG